MSSTTNTQKENLPRILLATTLLPGATQQYSADRNSTVGKHMAQNGHQPNRLALIIGFGIGSVWVITALYILVHAFNGFADHRPDYGMSWSLVGVFLLGGGVAALGGTWWHQLRKPQNDH